MTPNRSMNLLYPPLRRRVETGLTKALAGGLPAYVFEAWRARERQAYLYAQGRSTSGNIVTWVAPGLSAHEYGLAVDIVFDGSPTPGVQWSWEGDYAHKFKDSYAVIARYLKDEGLEWLGDSNVERAHFQMLGGMSLSFVRDLANARGVLGVWEELDKRYGVSA